MNNSNNNPSSFQVGDTVVYKSNGICKISDIRRENFDGNGVRDFYILRSVYDPRMQVFVPVNSKLSENMKYVISSEEIDKAIALAKSNSIKWIENAKERYSFFRNAIISLDRSLILSIYNLISIEKIKLERENKQLLNSDSRILAKLEKIITEECSYSLGISRDKVLSYILEKVNED